MAPVASLIHQLGPTAPVQPTAISLDPPAQTLKPLPAPKTEHQNPDHEVGPDGLVQGLEAPNHRLDKATQYKAPNRNRRALNLDRRVLNLDRRARNLDHRVLNLVHRVLSLGLRVLSRIELRAVRGPNRAVPVLKAGSRDRDQEVHHLPAPRAPRRGQMYMTVGPTPQTL